MYRTTAGTLAILLGVLGVAGLLINEDHLLDVINADIAIDVTRVVLAIALAMVAFGRASASSTRSVLSVAGIVLVLLGGLAVIDSQVFGLAPSGFTGVDIGAHLIIGMTALAVAAMATHEPLHATVTRDTRNVSAHSG